MQQVLVRFILYFLNYHSVHATTIYRMKLLNNMQSFCFSVVLILVLASFSSPQNTLPPPYTPTDRIFVSCGSPDNPTDLDGQIWVSDSTMISNKGNISFTSKPADPDSSVSDKPYYHNARIFLSNFTYSFPLSAPGPVFLRLYFYPKTYSGVNISTSFFSVVANGYTLVANFSANLSLPSDAPYISREFIVSSSGDLQVTFIPNPSSYGFVNAIQVVSMPANLYYDRSYKNISSPTDSKSSLLSNTTWLETVYRLNVGGGVVLTRKDTGMFRAWAQDQDIVSQSQKGSTAQRPQDLTTIDYYKQEDTPWYMAPEDVYGTARMMGGNDSDYNFGYNLTWILKVDPGFSYLVRLHFCETKSEITGPNQRVFTTYINNQTAEELTDVYNLAGGRGIPIHRDYVVFVPSINRDQPTTDMLLALHPYHEAAYHPAVTDVILNGAEVFKMSGPDRSLAGLNPNPPPSAGSPPAPPPRQSHVPMIAAGVSGGVVGLVFLTLLCFLIFRRSRRDRDRQYSGYKQGTSSWYPFSTSTDTKSTKSRGSSLPSDLCHHFTLAEIKAATNNFDQAFIIGAGGFGNVYKGTIDADTQVAIKRLNPGSKQGLHEFLTEIELLSRLRHLHLVSLIGFCEDDNEMILVYDYMSRGTLRDHLYNTQNPPLDWTRRLQLCIGAARGLQHLHTGANHTIIHRDVKTTNILLDEKWVAKVSDFGLSRIGSTTVSKAHVTTVVKGSFGYLDPEYFKRQHLTEKSDVYSFGVVLCEVICAKPPLVNLTGEKRRVSLAELARECYRRGTFESLVDAKLKGKIATESLNKYAEIAMKCLGENGSERPSMGDVVWGLEFVLELQKTADKRTKGEEEEEAESDDLWDESVTASTEVTTVVGSSISGERVSMD